MKDIIRAVDAYRETILKAERDIWATPELGYKEWKTSAYMEERFEELGYEITRAGNIPGFFTVVDTGREGPEILVFAELDAVICYSHPDADPETGAVHACGHNAECAALLGVAAALKDERVLSKMCGRIRLCVVPAEEAIETEYRATLRGKGIIKYLGGKSEFLSRGYFDGVDIAFIVHLSGGATDASNSGAFVNMGGGSLGFIAKTITYKGVAAHAGGAPWLGKNALYAAMSGLGASNSIRETFKDSDHVRWHPIITSGGDMVNNIPERVVIEGMLRASSSEALLRENEKIDRALIGGAISYGVEIEICDEPGYAPLHHDINLGKVMADAYNLLAPETNLFRKSCSLGGGIGGGTMDLGDLSAIMPTSHPYISGSVGKGHGNDYVIVDPGTCCVTNAKWQAMILMGLLENGAEKAKFIIENYHAPFDSKEAFLAHQDSMRRCADRITYGSDGKIIVE